MTSESLLDEFLSLPLFHIALVAFAVSFWLLFIQSTVKLLFNCYYYGRPRGIVVLLTITYMLTLFVNVGIATFIAVYTIAQRTPIHAHDIIVVVVRILGSYVILWLNFVIDCVMLSCLLYYFSDLFRFNRPLLIRRGIRILLAAVIVYLICVVTVSALIEVGDITVISLAILSYVHLLPIAVNIVVSLICICKLPLSQPLDLSIGLYQMNTKCSCYTRVTRYVWSLPVIGVAQIFYLLLHILDFDIWSVDGSATNQDAPWADLVGVRRGNKIGLCIYLLSQLVVLVWLYGYVYLSLKHSFEFHTVLEVIKGVYPLTSDVEDEEEEETAAVSNGVAGDNLRVGHMHLAVAQSSTEYDDVFQLQQQQPQQQQGGHAAQEADADELTAIASSAHPTKKKHLHQHIGLQSQEYSEDIDGMPEEEEKEEEDEQQQHQQQEQEQHSEEEEPQQQQQETEIEMNEYVTATSPPFANRENTYTGNTDVDAKMDMIEGEHQTPAQPPVLPPPLLEPLALLEEKVKEEDIDAVSGNVIATPQRDRHPDEQEEDDQKQEPYSPSLRVDEELLTDDDDEEVVKRMQDTKGKDGEESRVPSATMVMKKMTKHNTNPKSEGLTCVDDACTDDDEVDNIANDDDDVLSQELKDGDQDKKNDQNEEADADIVDTVNAEITKDDADENEDEQEEEKDKNDGDGGVPPPPQPPVAISDSGNAATEPRLPAQREPVANDNEVYGDEEQKAEPLDAIQQLVQLDNDAMVQEVLLGSPQQTANSSDENEYEDTEIRHFGQDDDSDDEATIADQTKPNIIMEF